LALNTTTHSHQTVCYKANFKEPLQPRKLAEQE